jgi:CSLREA domain-containing protein
MTRTKILKLTIFFFIAMLTLNLATKMTATALVSFTVNSTLDITDANPGDGMCATSNKLCTLRAAIQESNALAGEDRIMLPSGTYTLTIGGVPEDEAASGDLDITDNLILTGEGAENTIIDGNRLYRVFHVTDTTVTLQLHEVMITNGKAPDGEDGNEEKKDGGDGSDGGAIYNLGTLSLTDCIMRDNQAGDGGGGLSGSGGEGGNGGHAGAIYNIGTLSLADCIVRDNLAGDGGGGFSGGMGGNGGAIYNAGTLTLTDCTVSNNATGEGNSGFGSGHGGEGGGIYNTGRLRLSHCSVNSNLTGDGGWNTASGSYGGSGGAIYNMGTLTLSDCTVDGNATGDGGSGYVLGSPAGYGGGIYNEGTLTLSNSTISNNAIGQSGGDFSETGDGHGGGLYNAERLTLHNSTISGNMSNGHGGGIYNANDLFLGNVTLTNNSADHDGDEDGEGGGLYSSGSVRLKNTLIAGNYDNNPTTTSSDCISVSGWLNSLAYNLIQDVTNCNIGGNTTGNLTGIEANLGPLQDNGGPTFTHALLTDSPAIDAGNPADCTDETGTPLETDQRGSPRPADGQQDGTIACDIGAFELLLPQNSAFIPPAGGSLTYSYPHHSSTLTVPSNVLAEATQFTIRYHSPPTSTAPLLAMKHFVELSSSQTTFNAPLSLTLTYSDNELGAIIAGSESLYHWQDGQWTSDGISITEQQSDGLTAEISSLGFFGLLGESNWLYLPAISRN